MLASIATRIHTMKTIALFSRVGSRPLGFGLQRRSVHDSFTAINIMKDDALAPVERVRFWRYRFHCNLRSMYTLKAAWLAVLLTLVLISLLDTNCFLKPDSEYPEWLWTLLDPLPTKAELVREAQMYFDEGGNDAVLDKMDDARLRRLFRLTSRSKIKEENALREEGIIL